MEFNSPAASAAGRPAPGGLVTVRVLAAGDHFVLNRLLIDALRKQVSTPLDIVELTLPRPATPFGPVAEVREASGTEEQIIEALRGVEKSA